MVALPTAPQPPRTLLFIQIASHLAPSRFNVSPRPVRGGSVGLHVAADSTISTATHAEFYFFCQ